MRPTMTTPIEGVEVYDVDSGLGGHFTVSIIQKLDEGIVIVRIWNGHLTPSGWKSHGLFDGKTFETNVSKLINPRILKC